MNRMIFWGNDVFTVEGDPKHRDIFMKEWTKEHCSGVDTRLTVSWSELPEASAASKVRRAVPRINYMASVRAIFLSVARVASQFTS